MAPSKIIIDTDPGVDDVHALLMALAASPSDLEIELISVTFGNVDSKSCLRNVVALFNVIQSEIKYRNSKGLPAGFKLLESCKPRVAIGADGPLGGKTPSADYFHGEDGLAGIYDTYPQLKPQGSWERLFEKPLKDPEVTKEAQLAINDDLSMATLFTPSQEPAYKEILSILAANPPDSVTIIAVGPLTTCAIAAAADPQTFIRAKSVVVMGGALDTAGNMTPLAEFNIYADPVAAARVFALTSPTPASTIPPADGLPQYPSSAELEDRRLKIVLFPLDITHLHAIPKVKYLDYTKSKVEEGSPLATFGSYLFETTFRKLESLNHQATGIPLHDALCVWYIINEERNPSEWIISEEIDIRIETVGQWCVGNCVIDKRGRKKMAESEVINNEEISGDEGRWLSRKHGNKVKVCKGTPGTEAFTNLLLQSVFG